MHVRGSGLWIVKDPASRWKNEGYDRLTRELLEPIDARIGEGTRTSGCRKLA